MNFSATACRRLFHPFAAELSIRLASSTAFAKNERAGEKTFSVKSGARLSAETSGGCVRVGPGDVQSVRIVARQIFHPASDEANDIAKTLKLMMQQAGGNSDAGAT